jgi:hypothetical protein
MKINLDSLLTDLDGQPIREKDKDLKIFQVVAKVLSTSQVDGESVKAWDLALKFWGGAPVEIDDSDLSFVRGLVERSPWVAMIKGQVLKELDDQKLAAKSVDQAAAKA